MPSHIGAHVVRVIEKSIFTVLGESILEHGRKGTSKWAVRNSALERIYQLNSELVY